MTDSWPAMAAGMVVTAALCPASILFARRWGVLDRPGPRKVHRDPVPRMGGAAVLAGVLAAAAAGLPAAPGSEAGLLSGPVRGLLVGAVVVFLAGWWEDWKGISPWSRLALQSVGAGWAVLAGVGLPDPGAGCSSLLEVFLAAASFLWMVGMANAFNFVDGLDGLAAGVGVASSALLWPVSGGGAFLAAGLCGACLGFLPYNGYRARTFLGDGGATFIGFLLAGLGLLAAQGHGASGSAAAVAALALPVADLACTTVSRIRRGEVRGLRSWVEFAARDHLHHRLLDAGFAPPAAAAVLVAAHACAAAGLLLLAR